VATSADVTVSGIVKIAITRNKPANHQSKEQTKDLLLEVLNGMQQDTPDVLIRNAGTVFVFCPLTQRAKEWFDVNVASESWQWFGNALVVEPRYAWALAQSLRNEGLVIA
jgi:hypothetical protein